MSNAFYIAATGLDAGQNALDTVANNIANMNTVGFKRSQVRFSELVGGAAPADPAGLNTQPVRDLAGVEATTTGRVFTQGELKTTGSDSDLAISGNGFIELMGPGGRAYLWRGGQLKVNADGYLAADNGMLLKAHIAVPPGSTSIKIAADGVVSAVTDQQESVIGQIDVALPRDTDLLTPMGDALFEATPEARLIFARPGEEGAGALVQGALEGSNVQLTEEMVAMMMIQRAYSANAQIIQASDQLMAIANDLRR